jgi:hypothetical protein
MFNYPYIDYWQLKENYESIETSMNYISKMDNAWKWIKDITELKDLGQEKLTLPKELKIGEIANVLSSGYINGTISLENNKAKHVVIGGTRKVTKEESKTYKGEDGKKVTETTIVKMSKPYLNVLCSIDGMLQIKELGEDAE